MHNNQIYTKVVLLVEDDYSIAQLYITKLENENYKVVHAIHGLDGVKKIKDITPDIVLLDLRMPVMSGEEFLQLFRKNPDNADIPVLVLTNISREEAPKTLWHYGISDYFVKAHNTPKDLVEIINKVLSIT